MVNTFVALKSMVIILTNTTPKKGRGVGGASSLNSLLRMLTNNELKLTLLSLGFYYKKKLGWLSRVIPGSSFFLSDHHCCGVAMAAANYAALVTVVISVCLR